MNASDCKPFRLAAILFALSVVPSCGRQAGDCEFLELLGTSALNYSDTYGRFPPAVVLDESGRRMHSWRVLLLPYIEANAFAEEYDFDAAWNDPANADLADGSRYIEGEKFPDPASVREVYQPHLDEASPEDFTTDFLMVVGSAASVPLDSGVPYWPPGGGGWKTPAVPNSDELIIVQVRKSDVHWMEPRDIVLASPAPEWGIAFDDIKDHIVASVLVSDERVVCNDREATLKLLANRKSNLNMDTEGVSISR